MSTTFPLVVLIAGLCLVACGDSNDPGDLRGTLTISTSTTGDDQDGYRLMVDEVPSLHLDPSGTAEIDLASGQHRLRLVGVADQCSVSAGAEREVNVTARSTTSVTFHVVCEGSTLARIAFVRRRQPGPGGGAGAPEIYLADTNGSRAARLVSGQGPAWSPDGRRIAFEREGAIHVIDADGFDDRTLGRGGHPAWSPDGSRIAFHTGFSRDDGIFVINADGSGRSLLLRRDFANPGSDDWIGWPEWSSAGTISFVRAPGYDSYEPWQIYVMHADGSEPRNLNVLRGIGGSFAEVQSWSADGSRIALGVHHENYWAIASVDSSGADFKVHHRDELGSYAAHPDWSPDGRSLVFEGYVRTSDCVIPSCPRRIFMVNVDGGAARQLIPEVEDAPPYWDHQPTWSNGSE